MSQRCCEKVWQEYRWGKCTRDASVERDGKWYCWQHDPERTARKEQVRREASEAKWKRITNQAQRNAAEHQACVGVPVEVLEKVRVAELLEENEALRALLWEWLDEDRAACDTSGRTVDLAARTRAVLDTTEKGEKCSNS